MKASTLQRSAFFMVQLSHPYMTIRKTIVLTRWNFVSKVMSLLFNMLCRLVIAFLPRSKHFLISWLQSPSTVVLEPKKIRRLITHKKYVVLTKIIRSSQQVQKLHNIHDKSKNTWLKTFSVNIILNIKTLIFLSEEGSIS